MQPTNKEMQQHQTCKLYAYLLLEQGKDIPDDIEECACAYDYLVDCVVDLSAEIKSLDEDTFERILNNKDVQESRELAYWWEMCQEADRLRKVLVTTCA